MHEFLLLAQTIEQHDVVQGPSWQILTGGLLVFIGALWLFSYVTQSGNISRATSKEAVRQPIFFMLLAIAIVLLVLNTFIPFFTLKDDVKMQKDCGLATILICGMLLAIWTSSTSIAEEIEGKTAMTLLSKPINRRQFILGKFVGILQAVVLLLVPLCLCFLMLVYYKVGYDARESGKTPPDWFEMVSFAGMQIPLLTGERLASVSQIVPGVILIFFEITVMTAVSVMISTRLPMVVNMVSCFVIFVIGHLTPVLVAAGVLQLEFVSFMARLIAAVLPSLDVFNIQAAVATGRAVPADYIGLSFIYCATYCATAILLAFILFEDRDLA